MCIESEPHFLHGFLRRTNDTNESNKRTNKNFNEFILKSTQDRRMRNGNAVCSFANTLVHTDDVECCNIDTRVYANKCGFSVSMLRI